ncbi:unnamed protein product, partial [Effrenium voratum]
DGVGDASRTWIVKSAVFVLLAATSMPSAVAAGLWRDPTVTEEKDGQDVKTAAGEADAEDE